MSPPSAHLVERAAERLRGASGLLDKSPAGTDSDVNPDAPVIVPPTNGHDVLIAREVAHSATDAAPPAVARVADRGTATAHGPEAPLTGRATPDQSLARNGTSQAAGQLSVDRPAPQRLPAGIVPPGIRPIPGIGGKQADDEVLARATPRDQAVDASALERAGLMMMSKMRNRISEELRVAVNQVLRTVQKTFAAGHPAANIVMVTSSRPGEGKSFMSLNLAGCIAMQNQREVLLVDTDAKMRPLTHELGLADVPGLLDLARDPTMRIEDAIASTALSGLSVLPIGSRQPEADETAAGRPISAIVERIGRRFTNRIIVLDTPPCLSTSDPSELAPVVGQIVMVVEAERTQRQELEAALDLIATCPTVTLMLNKVQRSTSYTFGAYHYLGTYS
jgi:receptor protein-tyrosine kinase